MKDSLKNFYEYISSEEDLMYCVRINVEWNENSFNKMKQLARAVIEDYAEEDYYPKSFIRYFMRDIPAIINILSHYKVCTDQDLLAAGYTNEMYQCMIAEKIKQLKAFQREFIDSLRDTNTKCFMESYDQKKAIDKEFMLELHHFTTLSMITK